MRENIPKREGLGMGLYRNKDLGLGIRWTMDGKWCKSLGVPISNELDEAKWWQGKINSTRSKTKLWVGLSRSTYYGRNLITQAMYFGRLRYWLYSLRMTTNILGIVQKDADILWWSSDPKLEDELDPAGAQDWAAGITPDADIIIKNGKRIRRWVAADSAIGPRNRGGVCAMTWADHVNAMKAQWIIRYVQPGDAAWKRILDGFLLTDKKGTSLKYPEGRSIVLMKLTNTQKAAMLKKLPKKALYWKECLKAFWKLNFTPDYKGWEGYAAESPWHGHRTEDVRHGLDYRTIQYFKSTLKVTQMADFMNQDTNSRFTRREWRQFVDRMERASTGRTPDNYRVAEMGDAIYYASKNIPRAARQELKKTIETNIDDDARVYLERGEASIPAIIIDDEKARLVDIDGVGKHHPRKQTARYRHFTVREAVMWGDRWAGPSGSVEAWPAEYKFTFTGGGPTLLYDLIRSQDGEAGISLITRALAKARMKPPLAETTWADRLGRTDFSKVWGIRADYVTPRDQVSWLKVQHRNLRVAASGGFQDTKCRVRGCRGEENQEHLVSCPGIQRDFWVSVAILMNHLGMSVTNTSKTWLLGIKADGSRVSREEAAIIFWAWRCLYAEVVSARVGNQQMNPSKAYANLTRMAYTRVKAYGAKWYRWYSRQHRKRDAKVVPRKHRDKKLIKTEASAEYRINPVLHHEFKRVCITRH